MKCTSLMFSPLFFFFKTVSKVIYITAIWFVGSNVMMHLAPVEVLKTEPVFRKHSVNT